MRVFSRMSLACTVAALSTPSLFAQKVVLWENGDPDGINGYSQIDDDPNCAAGLPFRALLDDFEVTDPGWDISCFEHHHLWNTLAPGSGTGHTLEIRDDAGGVPDQSTSKVLNVTSYTETATGNVFFSRPEALGLTVFDPCNLDPGKYWVEGVVCGPENNFWLTSSGGIPQCSECWVNYSDFGGYGPGSGIFGVVSDLAFNIQGNERSSDRFTFYCDPSDGHPNNAATIGVSGNVLSQGPITVDLSGGPSGQFTYLLIGDNNGIVNTPPGAKGDLCVVGGNCLGRYAKDIGSIDGAGNFSTDIENSVSGGANYGIPTCGGNIAGGDTWYFQYWHRQPQGQPSTFSQAVCVTFKP